MTPARIRECLDALRWSTNDLADRAGVNPVSARRWVAGKTEIPASIATWLEKLAIQAQTLPPRPPRGLEWRDQ